MFEKTFNATLLQTARETLLRESAAFSSSLKTGIEEAIKQELALEGLSEATRNDIKFEYGKNTQKGVKVTLPGEHTIVERHIMDMAYRNFARKKYNNSFRMENTGGIVGTRNASEVTFTAATSADMARAFGVKLESAQGIPSRA